MTKNKEDEQEKEDEPYGSDNIRMIRSDGCLKIPNQILKAAGIERGSRVIIEFDRDSLRITKVKG